MGGCRTAAGSLWSELLRDFSSAVIGMLGVYRKLYGFASAFLARVSFDSRKSGDSSCRVKVAPTHGGLRPSAASLRAVVTASYLFAQPEPALNPPPSESPV